MKAKSKPEWWNILHDIALGQLRAEWKPAKEFLPSISYVTLEDVRHHGLADQKLVALYRNGIACGQNTFFRLGTGQLIREDEK